jgi:hypothetical protein
MMGEVFQNLWKAAEWFFVVHEMTGRHCAIGNEFEGPANVVRRVMKSGFASDFRVVQEVRVESDFSSARAAPEEIDRATLADQLSS